MATLAPARIPLAQLLTLILERYQFCVEFEALVNSLRIYEVIVEGEAKLLEQILQQREQIVQLLESLQQEDNAGEDDARLAQIESLLAAMEWEVAEEICQALKAKREQYETKIREYRIKLSGWPQLLTDRRQALNAARDARAPVRQEREEYGLVDVWVDQAQRALSDNQYVQLHSFIVQLDERLNKFKEHTTAIEEKTKGSKEFARQADLLLLQSPPDGKNRYHYAVLLRTPGEPGSHGINIQGSTTMVLQDRELMSGIIERITADIQRRNKPSRAPNAGAAPASDTRAGKAETQGLKTRGDMIRAFLFDDEESKQIESIPIDALVREVGELMYRLFMPEQMQRYLLDTKCSVTITTNDLELPWELMSYQRSDDDPDEETFLCLSRPVARMPLGRAFPTVQIRSERVRNKRSFLLVRPSDDLAYTKGEIKSIKEQLEKQWADKVEITVLEGKEATGRALNKALRSASYDVIHFSGHAYFDKDEPDLSGLVLSDKEIFFAQKMRRLLKGRPLVFLNACESALTANEEIQPELGAQRYKIQGPAEGLASALIYGGALGCIGSLWPIYDPHAAEFALSFYNRVLHGDMIGQAMCCARRDVKKEFPDHITWAAFVLYGDPTFTLDDWSTY